MANAPCPLPTAGLLRTALPEPAPATLGSYLLSGRPRGRQGPPPSAAAAPRKPGARRREASPASRLRRSLARRRRPVRPSVPSRPRLGGKLGRAGGEERRRRRCGSAGGSARGAAERGAFAGCPARSRADVTPGAGGTRFSHPPPPRPSVRPTAPPRPGGSGRRLRSRLVAYPGSASDSTCSRAAPRTARGFGAGEWNKVTTGFTWVRRIFGPESLNPSKSRASQAASSAQGGGQARTHRTHTAPHHPPPTPPPAPHTRTAHTQSGSRSRGAAEPGSDISIYPLSRLQRLPSPSRRAELCPARRRVLHGQGSSTPSTEVGWQVTAAVCPDPHTLWKLTRAVSS